MFLARLRTSFDPRYAWAKISLGRAKNIIFYAYEHQLHCYVTKCRYFSLILKEKLPAMLCLARSLPPRMLKKEIFND
jgi:hypothetical protein